MIDIEVSPKMSVSELHALEIIFYLRLQLAKVAWEDNESVYESICRERFEQISRAFIEKFKVSNSINEKIEILERIEVLSLELTYGHSEFALEEAAVLAELPDLTYAQTLRLKWITGITADDESRIVADLLPRANSSFEMATLALITDYCTDQDRAAVIRRYFVLFDNALKANDIVEIGRLLTVSALWNMAPQMRAALTAASAKVASLEALSIPEKRVNPIATALYARIDALTGKYESVSA